MYDIKYRNHFKKDIKRLKKRGKNLNKLKYIIELLVNRKVLPEKFCDHSLIGDYAKHRECHIEADWLLIYKIASPVLILERTGSHADLFKYTLRD